MVSSVRALKMQQKTYLLQSGEPAGPAGFAITDWGEHFQKSKAFASTAVHHKDDPDVENLVKAVVTIPSNPFYRVSDVMCHKGHGVKTCIKHVLEDSAYSGTALNLYLQKREKGSEKGGIALLKSVIDQGNWSVSQAQSTDLVVHVRAGDRDPKDPAPVVQNLMQNPACKNVSRIVVVTAKAFQTCAPGEPCEDAHEQQKYRMTDEKLMHNDAQLRKIFADLSKIGLEVKVQSHMHVDQDLAFIASAKCFVHTSGGFSQGIMAPLVAMNGGAIAPGSRTPKHCKW